MNRPWINWKQATEAYLRKAKWICDKGGPAAGHTGTWPTCSVCTSVCLQETGFLEKELLGMLANPDLAPVEEAQGRLALLEAFIQALYEAPSIQEGPVREALYHLVNGNDQVLVFKALEAFEPSELVETCWCESGDFLDTGTVYSVVDGVEIFKCSICGRRKGL